LYDQFFNAFEELGAVLKDLQRDELEEAKVQLRRLLDLPNREFLPKDRENVKGLLKFLSPQRPN
jgi:hypothetical protein